MEYTINNTETKGVDSLYFNSIKKQRNQELKKSKCKNPQQKEDFGIDWIGGY